MALMGRIALWGGTDGTRQYADFWLFDPLMAAWTRGRYAPGNTPVARAEHAGVAQGMHYCIFGGFGGTKEGEALSNSAFLNDMWCATSQT